MQQQRKDSAERIVGRRFTVALQSTALNALRSQSTEINNVEQADDDGANVKNSRELKPEHSADELKTLRQATAGAGTNRKVR